MGSPVGHAAIVNRTPFAFEAIHLTDVEGRPLVVLVVKATFDIVRDASLAVAAEQLPVAPAGVPNGEPGKSSYRYEPEVSWQKPATDVVLVGHAWAPRGRVTSMDIELAVGPVRKRVRVFGDRAWTRGLLSFSMSPPAPFEQLPLVYERAYGGWDRSRPEPDRHACDPRNPVGRGFRLKGSPADGVPLPNLEDPQDLISRPQDRPAPAGVGFTSPGWQPRAALAGTYDAAWQETRAPLLPADFDRRFFNAASAGMISRGHLRGDELVRGTGVTRSGKLSFALPRQPPPTFLVQRRSAPDVRPEGRLDTVVVDTDSSRVFLLWRAEVTLRESPHEVLGILVEAPVAPLVRARG